MAECTRSPCIGCDVTAQSQRAHLLLRIAQLKTALIEALAIAPFSPPTEIIQHWTSLLGPADLRRVDELRNGSYPGRMAETERVFDPTRDPRSPAFTLGTIPNPTGPGIVEQDPACCHHGHPYTPGQWTRGWQPCRCGGHRTWRCGCGDEVLWPVAGPDCRVVTNYGTGGRP